MNDGVRRKNATRESTNTLKAWLNEHKKNPYPTKGEKIMLAIITKMTLTQVKTNYSLTYLNWPVNYDTVLSQIQKFFTDIWSTKVILKTSYEIHN